MKLKTTLLMLLLVGCIVCSCDNDRLTPDDEPIANTSGKNTMYLSVKLSDVDSGSRAESDGFSDAANDKEKDIQKVSFYFYDSAGHFMAQASYSSNGEAANTIGSKVNFDADTKTYVVTVGNITSKPFAMMTVINPPQYFMKSLTETASVPSANFVGYPSALEMRTLLANDVMNQQGYLTMSTATYFKNLYSSNSYPFNYYTLLSDEYLKDTYIEAAESPVTVNVERLAAKVVLNLSNKIKFTEKGLFALNDLAGNPVKFRTITSLSSETLYLKILGWGVNAEAKESYLYKNLNTYWSPIITNGTNFSFTWNDTTNERSYWAASYNYYDKDHYYQTDNSDFSYPASYSSSYNADNVKQLRYKSATSFTTALGTDIYCMENTNSVNIVSNNYSAITSALLLAQLVDENGTPFNDAIFYNGMLFKQPDYLEYAIDIMKRLNTMSCSYKDEDGKTVTIGAEHVTLRPYSEQWNGTNQALYNAEVCIQLKDEYRNKQWYSSTNLATKMAVSDINAQLSSFNSTNKAYDMKDGKMYYNIPIEHLGKTGTEGEYGVVRNHYYHIEIMSINNIGHPIYDDNEPIIPQKEDSNIYYIGTSFNIMSWKDVKQSINL
jgi:hypothetical protein